MIMPSGLLEIVVVTALSAAGQVILQNWGWGIVAAGFLIVAFALLTCAVNFACLPAGSRSPLLNCLTVPFSTLAVIVPRVVRKPSGEQAR